MKLKLDEYNQQFVDLCENENFKDRLNEAEGKKKAKAKAGK